MTRERSADPGAGTGRGRPGSGSGAEDAVHASTEAVAAPDAADAAAGVAAVAGVAAEDAARVALNRARAAAQARGARPALRPGRVPAPGGAPRARRGGGDQARSGSGPDARDPQAVSGSIERLVTERGWQAPVAVGGVIGRWDQVVGADVAAHCTAETYEEGVLTVRADSTAWATQVRLLSPTVLRRLGEELGEGVVQRLVVRGPAAPTWHRGSRSVSDGRGPRDTYG